MPRIFFLNISRTCRLMLNINNYSLPGNISVEEFQEACELLSQHTKTPLSKTDIHNMARNIDMNNDGYIDFNEFLEAFRIVDTFGRELQRRQSQKEMDARVKGGEWKNKTHHVTRNAIKEESES